MTPEEMKQLIKPSYPKKAHLPESPWQALADAVILQAAEDYSNALHGIGIGRKPAAQTQSECERFFQSEWFFTLTDVDGVHLMKQLATRMEGVQ